MLVFCFVFFVVFQINLASLYNYIQLTSLGRRDWNPDPESPVRAVSRLETVILLVSGRQIKGDGVTNDLNYHGPEIADLHPIRSLQTGI